MFLTYNAHDLHLSMYDYNSNDDIHTSLHTLKALWGENEVCAQMHTHQDNCTLGGLTSLSNIIERGMTVCTKRQQLSHLCKFFCLRPVGNQNCNHS